MASTGPDTLQRGLESALEVDSRVFCENDVQDFGAQGFGIQEFGIQDFGIQGFDAKVSPYSRGHCQPPVTNCCNAKFVIGTNGLRFACRIVYYG